MSGISTSDYTNIAQLDGALAFNFILNETQELISSSALSGLKGLREAMGTGGQIAEAFRQLEQVTKDLGAAVEAENKNQFSAGNSTTALAVATAVDNSLKSQTSGVVTSANAAVSVANVSDNGGSAAAKAKDAADLNRQAADDLAAGDSQAGRSKANSAAVKAGEAVSAAGDELAAAKSQRDTAQDQVNGLDAQLQAAQNANPPNPALIASLTADRNAAEVALNAAQQTVNRAQALLTAAQTVQTAADATLALANSPIALIDSETPTAYDLENGFTLSTWGSSGYWTLIDENGEGIIVSPDGQVDPLDGSGEGWQFFNVSTFVLPDGAKITVTPGSSASLQVTRGNALLELDDLGPGAVPSVVGPKKGGRAADQGQNDGHIFTTSGAGSQWQNGSNTLGVAGNREQVATSPIANELRLDALDVQIPEGLRAYLEKIGFDFTANDYDGDGKLNAQELALAADSVARSTESFSAMHRAVLAATAEGVEALLELNLFLENLMRGVDDAQQDRKSLSSEEAAVADSILERLNAAFAGLGAIPSPALAQSASQPGNQAQNLPSELATIIDQASSLSPGQVAARVVSALGQLGTGPVLAPDQLAEKVAARLAGLAAGGPRADEFGNLIGELGVLLAQASGSGELGNAVRGALTRQIAELLEARLGGALPPGAIGELAQQISGVLAQAAGDGDISLAGVSEKIAGLLGAAAAQGGLTGDTIATLSRQLAAFLPRILADAALPNGGLIAFIQGFVTAVAKGGDAAANSETGSGAAGDASGNALRRAGRLISGYSLNPRIEAFAQALNEQAQEATGPKVSGAAAGGGSSLLGGLGGTLLGGGDVREILGNLKTDAEVLEQVQRNLDAATRSQGELLGQAENVFVRAQEAVERFFLLISDNQLLREIVFAEDLSEADSEVFMEKMNALYRNWGIEWGSTDEGGPRTPEVEAQLVNKAISSGMMI